jgi:hypothetical protein
MYKYKSRSEEGEESVGQQFSTCILFILKMAHLLSLIQTGKMNVVHSLFNPTQRETNIVKTHEKGTNRISSFYSLVKSDFTPSSTIWIDS